MARLLNDDGTVDQLVDEIQILELSVDQALPIVAEQYGEMDFLVDVLEIEPDGTMRLIFGAPGDGMAYEGRLTP